MALHSLDLRLNTALAQVSTQPRPGKSQSYEAMKRYQRTLHHPSDRSIGRRGARLTDLSVAGQAMSVLQDGSGAGATLLANPGTSSSELQVSKVLRFITISLNRLRALQFPRRDNTSHFRASKESDVAELRACM